MTTLPLKVLDLITKLLKSLDVIDGVVKSNKLPVESQVRWISLVTSEALADAKRDVAEIGIPSSVLPDSPSALPAVPPDSS